MAGAHLRGGMGREIRLNGIELEDDGCGEMLKADRPGEMRRINKDRCPSVRALKIERFGIGYVNCDRTVG
jgi:hypothetical protein